MKIAAIQLASGTTVSANLIAAKEQIEAAAAEGAGMVVLPENFAYLGAGGRDALPLCEEDGSGPLQDFLAQLAERLRIWVVGGTIPLHGDDPERWRAACLVYDHRGERIARYDKWHLFDVAIVGSAETYTESAAIEPGERIVVVDTPAGRLGLAVCYDLRFPELFRAMVDRGAEIFALPAAFTAVTGKAHWHALLRARAIENLAFVIAAAQGGFHTNRRETFGHSILIDPWGQTLAETASGSGFALADIDRDFQRKTRRSFPCLDHRRIHCA